MGPEPFESFYFLSLWLSLIWLTLELEGVYPDKKADLGSTVCRKLALTYFLFVSLKLIYLGQHFLSPLARNQTDLSILGLSEETLSWN